MASFLERIDHHLRRVQRIEAADVVDADKWPDLARHDSTVVELFEQINAPDQFSERWNRHQLDHFVDEMHWELLLGIGGRTNAADRGNDIDAGIAIVVNRVEQASSPRAQRLRDMAWIARETVDSWPGQYEWEIVSRYCERLGMVRDRPAKPSLRLAGQMFLRLRGLDRLRWLLSLEAVSSVDDEDESCMSVRQAAAFVEHAGREWAEILGLPPPRPMWSSVARWSGLGVAETWEYEDITYQLTDVGRALFDESQGGALDVFRTLAAAEADDLRNEILARSEASSPGSAAAAELRYARLVAHEVRNALLPVRFELSKIWKTVEQVGNGSLSASREKIEEGIGRLYAFVETSARMTAPVDELPARCKILDVLDEARRELMPALSGSITVETLPGSADPSCLGPRGRLVLAFTNILRNAVQAGGAEVKIEITVDASDPANTKVIIEDNGPGIDETVRHHIFENGVSTRKDGTGHGLALVREVVEQDMRGTVSYEPRPEGGARFCLELPSPQEQR